MSFHSDDAPLRHRLAGIFGERAYICHAPDQHRLEELLGGGEPLISSPTCVCPASWNFLPRLGRLYPHVVVVALGHSGSAPFQMAQEAGVYRAISLEADRQALRDLSDLVIERVGWMQEPSCCATN